MGKLPFELINRKIKIISDESTVSKIKDQEVKDLIHNGIIIIDKPAGPTSHQVSDFVKKILHIDKAGHSGTLDPNVTGVLPVALDKGTKIIQALLNAGKEYICVMHVHEDFSKEKITNAIMSFMGKIQQLPPIKSAVKRQIREREIYYLEIIEIKGRDVLFKIGCQGGTYIRKLCSDIGEKLDCGAHMAELRRTKAGPFREDQVVILQDLADAYHAYKNGDDSLLKKIIMPIETGIKHLPKIWVKKSTVKSLCTGAQLKMPGILQAETEIKIGELIAVLNPESKLVLLGEAKIRSREIKPNKKGLVVKTMRVFMIK